MNKTDLYHWNWTGKILEGNKRVKYHFIYNASESQVIRQLVHALDCYNHMLCMLLNAEGKETDSIVIDQTFQDMLNQLDNYLFEIWAKELDKGEKK